MASEPTHKSELVVAAKPAHALHDPIRHNAWATAQVMEFCHRLDANILNATVPGTYGTIIATLRHLIYCEIDFLDRLLTRESTASKKVGETTGLSAHPDL